MNGILKVRLCRLWVTLAMSLVMLGPAGCMQGVNKPASEGFAIYVVAQQMATAEILGVDLSAVELEDKPLLSTADIITYAKATHEMTLSPAANQRLAELKVPTSGVPFVACVNRQPIYGGAFWVGYSSQSFEGIVIDTLYAQMNLPVRIQLGYPGSTGWFVGEDHRSDVRVMQSLEAAGKLKQ